VTSIQGIALERWTWTCLAMSSFEYGSSEAGSSCTGFATSDISMLEVPVICYCVCRVRSIGPVVGESLVLRFE
jgi:hypothetical protein